MSSDEEIDPRQAKSSGSQLKSMFASDSRAAMRGSTSLKYEAKSKKDDPAASAGSAAPSGANQPQQPTVTAAQAQVQVYRGDVLSGPSIAVIIIVNGAPMVALVDRDRRPLCRVRVNADLQLLQNHGSPQYATLYDPSIGQHWTLLFKGVAECTGFVTATATLMHYLQLADGPVEPVCDLVPSEPSTKRPAAKKGDTVAASYTVWLLQRVGGGGAFFTVGKIVEEVPVEAPKQIKLGLNEVMIGIEEALVGMTQGGKRIAFVSPRKAKSSGIGNPEIGSTDSVVVVIQCHEVNRGKGDGPLGLADSDADDDVDDIVTAKRGKAKKSLPSQAQEPPAPQQAFQPVAPPPGAPAPAVMAAPPAATVAAASPVIDQNTLIQTMLLQTLQMQQQQREAPKAPVVAAGDNVERGLDRIYQQLFNLAEKIDRIDIESKLAKNNEAVERMVKKAVGKMPVNDVDIEDMAKDRDQLLAKIEHLKKRVEEATDNYHKALESMGHHKDVVSSLKNDLSIERETSSAKIKELQERKRLELVDLEVRHRRDMDALRERTLQEGIEKGYAQGFAAGKLEMLQLSGSSSTDEIKQRLHAKEQEVIEQESRYQQTLSKHYQERREMLDQVQSLNNLIKKLESRESSKAQGIIDTSSAMCKTLRRAMNSTYASIEAQFYATESTSVSVEDALAMVLISIKSETKTYVDEIKREGALIVSASQNLAAARSNAEEELDANGEAKAAYLASSSEPPPPPPPTSAATEAYLAMKAEIEQYQRERDEEARQAENSQGKEECATSAPAVAGQQDPSLAAFDISSLPLDESEDGGDRTPPPPPPLPALLFAPPPSSHQLEGDDETTLPPPPVL